MSAQAKNYPGLIPLTELAILPYPDPPSIPALRQRYDVRAEPSYNMNCQGGHHVKMERLV